MILFRNLRMAIQFHSDNKNATAKLIIKAWRGYARVEGRNRREAERIAKQVHFETITFLIIIKLY